MSINYGKLPLLQKNQLATASSTPATGSEPEEEEKNDFWSEYMALREQREAKSAEEKQKAVEEYRLKETTKKVAQTPAYSSLSTGKKDVQSLLDTQQKAATKVNEVEQNLRRMNDSSPYLSDTTAYKSALEQAKTVQPEQTTAPSASSGESMTLTEAVQRIKEIDAELAELSNIYVFGEDAAEIHQKIQSLEQEKQELGQRTIQENNLQLVNATANLPWSPSVSDSAFEAARKIQQNPADYSPSTSQPSVAEETSDLKSAINLLVDAQANQTSPTAKTREDVSAALQIFNKYGGDLSQYSVMIAKAESGDEMAQKELEALGYYDALEYAKYLQIEADARAATDFAEKSQYVSTEKPKTEKSADDKVAEWFQIATGTYTEERNPYEDILYEIVNGNKEAYGYASNAAASGGGDDAMLRILSRIENNKSEALQMTEDEVALFNYLYATEGKASAYAYYDYLDLVQREYAADMQNTEEFAKKHPFFASLFSIGGNFLISPYAAADQLGSYIGGEEIDPYSAANRTLTATSLLQSTVAQTIKEAEDKWYGGKVSAWLYNNVMSVASNAARIVASGGNEAIALALMGTQSMAGQVLEAKQRGLTDDQAMALGVIAGAAEILTEKVSIESLFDQDAIVTGTLKYVLNQMVTEASEEGASFMINLVADILISKDDSEWTKSINGYMADGYSVSEATGMAIADQAKELGLSMLGGAFSGGVMGVGSATSYSATMQNYGEWVAKNVDISQQEISAFVDAAMNANPDTTLYKVASQLKKMIDSGKTVSSYDIGRLLQASYLTAEKEMDTGTADTGDIFTFAEDRTGKQEDTVTPGMAEQGATATAEARNQSETPDSIGVDALFNFDDPTSSPVAAQTGVAKDSRISAALSEYVNGGFVANETLHEIALDPALATELSNETGVDIRMFTDYENQDIQTAIKILSEKMASPATGQSGNVAPTELDIDDWLFFDEPGNETATETVTPSTTTTDTAEAFRQAAREVMGLETETPAEVQPQPETRLPEATAATSTAITQDGNAPAGAAQIANAETDTKTTPASTASEWSVGAANADFTGKAAYNELLSDENSQPDRPTDVRPMEVLETDPYGRKVTEFAANAYGAGVTSDAMADRIQELIMEGALGFDTKTNEQTLEEASREMVGKSKEKIQSEIIGNISDGHIKDGDIAKAMLLYADYAAGESADSQNNAAEMMVALSMMANKAGRDLQLFSMLRRMTPQGQLMAVEKTIQKQITKMNQGRNNSRQIQDVSISPELQQEYMEAAKEDSAKKTKETAMRKAAAEDAIYKEAASQIKATPKEKWDTYRYMCMLGNARTNIRNVFGNAMYIPYTEGKRIIGTAMEKMFLPKEQRTKALLGLSESDQALLKWAREDAKTTAADALKYSAKIGDDVSAAKLQNERQIFDSALMENVRKLVEWAPSAGDMLFKNAEYSKSLAGFLKARGYTVGDIESNSVSDAVLGEARAYAVQEAMKATFNDCNVLSDFVANTLRFKGNNPVEIAANAMLEGVLPFRRTPANIIVRALENSPLGLARGIFNAATKVRSGEMSAATAIDQIAAGLAGSAAYALGFALANGIGAIRLRGYLDDEDKERQGYQSYALEITANGKVYSYDISWAAPANLPLFVGANLYQAFFQEDEDADLTVFTKALYGCVNVLEPMLELSCLSSLTDLLESVRYADSGEIVYTVAVEAATSYFTQGIPTLLRQAYQASQTTKQQTFANSEDPLIRSLQRKVANIPFVGAAFQTDKVDEWGEPVSRGNIGERILDAFFNPGNYSVIETDALEQEIASLNGRGMNAAPPDISKTISFTDADGNVYKDRRLTEEEYNTLRTVQGQTSAEILNNMISTGDYAALPDDLKAKAFEYAYDYARETARSQAVDGYSVTTSWMQGIEENTAAAIIQKVTAGELSSASTALTASWKSGTGADAALDTMESAYQTYLSMSDETRSAVLENSTSTVQTYIDFRENGGTASEYATIYQPVTLGKDAISDAKAAFKEELSVSNDIRSAMSNAYRQYARATASQKVTILENASTDTKALFTAMDAGVNIGTFVNLYKQYYAITKDSEASGSEQATAWADVLQKAVESGQITQEKADTMESNLRFYVMVPAEATAYHNFVDAGLSSDQSYDLMDLLSGIEAEEGYANVRPIQKIESVASSSFLSDEEKVNVLKIYLGDSQDEALDRFMASKKYSIQDYVAAYRCYLDANSGMDKTITALKALGYSPTDANALYHLLKGN